MIPHKIPQNQYGILKPKYKLLNSDRLLEVNKNVLNQELSKHQFEQLKVEQYFFAVFLQSIEEISFH